MVSLGCVLKTVLGKAYPWQQRVIVVPTSVFQSLSMNLVIAWADPGGGSRGPDPPFWATIWAF